MEQFQNTITPLELADCLGGITVQGVHKALKTHDIPTQTTSNRRKIIPAQGIRKLFEERGFQYPKNIVSFQIVKGGVGKTSLSFCLALRASHYGARILAIDLDQQGNLTRSFNMEARDKPVWLNLFRDKVPIEKSIIELAENLHLIPSNLNNSRLDTELTQSSANLRDLIKDTVAPIRNNYDLIVIDCPPAINKINTAVTCASDIVIIPINPDPYAMDGLDFTLSEMARVKKDYKLSFDYRIVWNKYDARERLGAVYMHELTKRGDIVNNILPVVCRIDVSMKNAIFDSKSVFELPKKAPIREDIDQFTKEILGINLWKEDKK
ncbi:MAG TPA: ParA family protein [Hanamia sp.]|nr:ParA family protein [Hanamia sp.]